MRYFIPFVVAAVVGAANGLFWVSLRVDFWAVHLLGGVMAMLAANLVFVLLFDRKTQ